MLHCPLVATAVAGERHAPATAVAVHKEADNSFACSTKSSYFVAANQPAASAMLGLLLSFSSVLPGLQLLLLLSAAGGATNSCCHEPSGK